MLTLKSKLCVYFRENKVKFFQSLYPMSCSQTLKKKRRPGKRFDFLISDHSDISFQQNHLEKKDIFLYSCTFASLCLTFHLQDNKDSHMCCAAVWCEGLYLMHFAQQFVLLLWTFSALFSFIFF